MSVPRQTGIIGILLELLMVYVVAYDLKSPNDTGEDYERVIGGIKAEFRTWCHLEKSVWLISSLKSTAEIRDALKLYLYAADVLFVSKLSGSWAAYNLGKNKADWLRAREF